MGLDVYFRRDIANVLRSIARSIGGALRVPMWLLEDVTTKEQRRVLDAYKAGVRDALEAVGHSFGLEAVTAPRGGEVAGLLWAEAPSD